MDLKIKEHCVPNAQGIFESLYRDDWYLALISCDHLLLDKSIPQHTEPSVSSLTDSKAPTTQKI